MWVPGGGSVPRGRRGGGRGLCGWGLAGGMTGRGERGELTRTSRVTLLVRHRPP